jgi:cell wall-associated NlpC family hydrolase
MPRKKKTRGQLVADALPGWEGTPFLDQACVKGRGVDCKGLLWGVASELGFPEAQSEYAKDVGYSLRRAGGVPSNRLLEGFAALFDKVDEPEPGDILLLKIGGKPGHIAIYHGDGRAYHAQIAPNSHVKKATLRSLFFFYPLHSIWRWRCL